MRARSAVTVAVLTSLTLTVPALAAAPAGAAPAGAAPSGAVPSGVVPASTPDGSTAPAGFVGMAPTRVLDTRDASWNPDSYSGPLTAGQNFQAKLGQVTSHMPPTAHAVLPSDATAAVINVTVTEPTADGYLSLSSSGGASGALPTTSSINFSAGQTVANLVTVAVTPGSMPTVNIYNHVGNTHVVLDVVGYYRVGETGKYGALVPSRLVDTRTDSSRLGWDGVREVQVARPELGTADARSVILNVTATNGTWNSFLTVYPAGQSRPYQGSNLNFMPGQTVPNQVVVPVGADGKVDVYNHVGTVDVIVDIVGFYGPTGQGLFSALKSPLRLFDSRSEQKLSPYSTSRISAAGSNTAPADALGAALNVTVTEPTDPGHLTVYPAAAARPNTSNLNFTAGQTVANSATSGLDGGAFEVYHHSAGRSHVIADLGGWFVKG